MRRIEIGEEWAGTRIDRLVRALAPGLSFAGAQAFLRRGPVTLNGRRARGGERLAAGDVVEIDEAALAGGGRADAPAPAGSGLARPRAPEPPGAGAGGAAGGPARLGPGERGVSALYEDGQVIVIDKPAGLPVQPGNEPALGSVLDLLAARRAASAGDEAETPPFPWTPVHRLDIGTTGVLVCAKTRVAARSLSAAFREGRVRKIYVAVTDGVPDPPAGTVDAPIAVCKNRSSLARVDAEGRPARTAYRLLRRLPGGRALVEAAIETGRTHQVRVHLASIGCPVAGDRLYGHGGGPLLLHARQLDFPHPATGRTVAVKAPLPAVFPPLEADGGEKP
ncbi:MAG: RluA family pseudouridine synthase [Candidatus Krumholzibacteriota bacterium]|nr:RluA family pseudouridine synthase [Candidatus Krumholzibacteriota bacterium]